MYVCTCVYQPLAHTNPSLPTRTHTQPTSSTASISLGGYGLHSSGNCVTQALKVGILYIYLYILIYIYI